jgi:hypothetical protein
MSKKWLNLILIGTWIVGLVFFSCSKKSTQSKPPEYPQGYTPISVPGNVDLPQGMAISESSLTITAGAFAQTKPNSAGNFSINLNKGATQLISATTPAGVPLLLNIAINPHGVDSVNLSPHSTAEAMIFLNPAVIVADPTLSQTVMNIVKDIPETQVLANTIQSKITSNPSALVTNDPDIKTALTNAMIKFVSIIDSLAVVKTVAPETRKQIDEFRDLKHYKVIEQKLLVHKSLKVGNLIIDPATPQSGISVSGNQIDANNYKITVSNSKKRYVNTYLDDASTGANIGKALLPSRKNLLSFSPLSPYSRDLDNNPNLSTHPLSILRAYSIGYHDRTALTSAPYWQTRVVAPIVLTGVFDFFIPLLQVVTGIQQVTMLGDFDNPGGVIGEIIGITYTDNVFLTQLQADIMNGDYTGVVSKTVVKCVEIVIQNPVYIQGWLTEQGLGAIASAFSAAVVPLRIAFIITSGFELGSAIYDFSTSSWLVSFTLYQASAPTPPTLSSPADEATGVATNPTLSWNASTGAASYTLQVSTNSSFSSFVVNQSSINTTSYAVSGLANSTTYYWRVNASNSYGTSDWSSIWSFTTVATTSKWTTYNTSNSGLASNFVGTIAIDASDNKWFGFGSNGGGVSKFDGTNWTTYNTSNSGLVSDYVQVIAIDATGTMWFGTCGEGVSKFDGTNWTTYNTSNSGLAHNYVEVIAIDVSGNKWFGTWGGGISKFDGTNWTTYNMSNSGLPDNWVAGIAIDSSGNKWFVHRVWAACVSRFDGANWTIYNKSNCGLPSDWISAIAIDASGNKWFGTDNGVSKFDGTNWITYNTSNSGLAGNAVHAIAIDISDNKWFSSSWKGISKFDGTNWTIFDTSNSGLAENNVGVIAVDFSGNKWFATWWEGVCKFHE